MLFKFPRDKPPEGRTYCLYSGTKIPSIARANKAANGELRVCEPLGTLRTQLLCVHLTRLTRVGAGAGAGDCRG
jgi:hypothetical protein